MYCAFCFRFGWVESRLRQLLVSLEQPHVVFCHPYANCFHREVEIPVPPVPMPRAGTDDAPHYYVSSFFIGLSFPNGMRAVDLTPTIQVDTISPGPLVVVVVVCCCASDAAVII